MAIKWVHVSRSGKEAFVLPVAPQEIEVKMAATYAKHTIIGLGEIEIPSGTEQRKISWEGILPETNEGYGYISAQFTDPKTIIGYMETYLTTKSEVMLTVDDTFSALMHLSAFTYKRGGKGDYSYNIEWTTAEEHQISSEIANSVSRAAKKPSNPYKAKKGQTLFDISKKVYGTGWLWIEIWKKNTAALKKAGNAYKRTAKLKKNIKLKW